MLWQVTKIGRFAHFGHYRQRSHPQFRVSICARTCAEEAARSSNECLQSLLRIHAPNPSLDLLKNPRKNKKYSLKGFLVKPKIKNHLKQNQASADCLFFRAHLLRIARFSGSLCTFLAIWSHRLSTKTRKQTGKPTQNPQKAHNNHNKNQEKPPKTSEKKNKNHNNKKTNNIKTTNKNNKTTTKTEKTSKQQQKNRKKKKKKHQTARCFRGLRKALCARVTRRTSGCRIAIRATRSATCGDPGGKSRFLAQEQQVFLCCFLCFFCCVLLWFFCWFFFFFFFFWGGYFFWGGMKRLLLVFWCFFGSFFCWFVVVFFFWGGMKRRLMVFGCFFCCFFWGVLFCFFFLGGGLKRRLMVFGCFFVVFFWGGLFCFFWGGWKGFN